MWPKAIPRPLRFHDLRHSCATILLRAGVDIHRVQRILRHASVTTTAGTYAHLEVNDLREGLGRGFGEPVAPPEPVVRRVAVGAGKLLEMPTDGDEGLLLPDAQAREAIAKILVTRVGLEPTTHGLKGRCSTS